MVDRAVRKERVLDAPGKLGRSYTCLWASATISSLGDGIRLAALPLLALTITHSPTKIALVSFAGQLPALTLSLLSGVLADRYNRRITMWVCDALRCVIVSVLAVLAVTKNVSILALFLVALALGTGQTLADQATHAFLPSVVEDGQLVEANSRLMSTRTAIGYFTGPLLGGALFAVGHWVPFAADALTFLAAGIIVATWVTPTRLITAKRPSEPIGPAIAEGLRYVWEHPALRGLAAIVAAVNLTQAATQAMLPLLATQHLHLGDRGYGALLAASGVGAAAAGVLGPRLRAAYGADRLFAASVIGTIAIFAGLALTSSALLAGALLAANTCLGVIASVLLASLRQTLVPNHLLGRVNSVMTLIGVGIGLTLGSLAGGTLTTVFGIQAPFFASAALISIAAIAVPRITSALRQTALR